MKLVSKTQRLYLALIVVLLEFGGILFMFITSSVIEENIDESLYAEMLSMKQQPALLEQLVQTPQRRLEVHRISKVTHPKVQYSDTTFYISSEDENYPYRVLTAQFKEGNQAYQIMLRRSKVEYEELLSTFWGVELFFMITLLIGLYFINKNVVERLWQPFFLSLDQLTDYHIAQKEKIDWPDTDIDEFQRLNEALADMLNQVEQEYYSLKSFTENASHEIQTPLSSIVNQVELLLQTGDLEARHLQKLKQIDQKARKLSRLNKALILLTKIENNQYPEPEQVDIAEVLRDRLDEYRVLADAREISIDAQMISEPTVTIHPDLADILIRNLLSNAIKHNEDGGAVTVHLDQDRLLITNTGAEPDQDPELYLNRFQKGQAHKQSLGLGLSIVAAIADQAGWKLEYRYDEARHRISVAF
jgi:signal transduction histidine kinase